MLQICSGKLFNRDVGLQNNLIGVIYTNLMIFHDEKIETAAGSISKTSNLHTSNAIIYELKELIEAPVYQPGTIASHGIDDVIVDFSAILSFTLNCTATPSHTLTDRLLSDQLGVSTRSAPKKIVKRVFDNKVSFGIDDEDFLIRFTKQLIGLNRKTYLGVISSIRTYITGMHRIADDFELAYTLLVASIESLAQNFDGHQSTWADYDQSKKKVIDTALDGVDEDLSEKIKIAILSNEHTTLARRFKDFSIDHINPSYFRTEATDALNPISKMDLPIALNNAYQARSKYVHKLEKLPKRLTFNNIFTETCQIDKKTWLTLQGLSRLARHVIIEFVMRQSTIEKEPHNYYYERPHVLQLELSPELWISRVDFTNGIGIKKLEGFLSILADCKNMGPKAAIPDLTDLLTELERKFDKIKNNDKQPFIAIYILYNYFIEEKYKLENSVDFISKYENYLFKPNSSALITAYLVGLSGNLWDLETHDTCLTKYFNERHTKNNFRCPRIFESGLLLQLAERYRVDGNITKAIKLIEMAVENHPDNSNLQNFEEHFKRENHKIDDNKILWPKTDNNQS